nr:RNA polymerase sigma factor RpoD/SigA [Mucilaginibacter sp. L294]
MKQLIINQSITNRTFDAVEKYFKEVNKIRLLTRQEEADLSRRAREGDKQALDTLTTTNLRFVISVAKQYQNQGLPFADLICEGNIGLIKAAKRFDETKGFKFISYAVWWIRQSISMAIAEQVRTVHLPNNYHLQLGKLHSAIAALEQLVCRKPSMEELVDFLNLPEERIIDLFAFSSSQVSLDQPLSVDGEFTMLDVLTNTMPDVDDQVSSDLKWGDLFDCLIILNKTEKKVISSYFGIGGKEPLSLNKIADDLKFSVEHTRRIKDAGLYKIRHSRFATVLQTLLS